MVPPRVSRPDRPRADGRGAERRISADRKRDKRAQLVDRLLGDEYNDEYARNWTTIWTNILIGRTGGTERRSLVDRDGMQQYLSEALQLQQAVRRDGARS